MHYSYQVLTIITSNEVHPLYINKNYHSFFCASYILKNLNIQYIIKLTPCAATFSLPLIGALKVKELVLQKKMLNNTNVHIYDKK